MNASVNVAVAELVPLVDAFALRCWARAYLVQAGELSLHDAVDGLQAAAESTGLVAVIGQDGVQAIMAEQFQEAQDAG